jgi:phosphate-selective porin OprO/OprP
VQLRIVLLLAIKKALASSGQRTGSMHHSSVDSACRADTWTRSLVFRLLTLGVIAIAASNGLAQESDANDGESRFSYGSKGLQYLSPEEDNFLWFGVRLQTRYTNFKDDIDDPPGQVTEEKGEVKLNRGRLKLGGHLLTPKFTVYTEYDFTKDQLLDFRASYEFAPWFSLRAGQWKSEYNRERIDSSGAQQFVDRSIATPWFTIDRQKGVVASGRLGAGTPHDSSYWFGRLSAAGRGGDIDDADGFWMGRYQWNFTRRVLSFSQSDLGQRKQAAGSIAIAAVSGDSKYTSFSGSGGGQLPGYVEGEPDQYHIEQALFESAWQLRGFSWQQELHWKQVKDSIAGTEQSWTGGYVQAGMFFSEIWSSIPEPLEFAIRFASVESGDNVADEKEFVLAANWFFNGHRNKLTSDISRRTVRGADGTEHESRLRLQWDVSF